MGRARHLWLDGGGADRVPAAAERLWRMRRDPDHHWPAGHDGGYSAHYAAYLRFYARALRRAGDRAAAISGTPVAEARASSHRSARSSPAC